MVNRAEMMPRVVLFVTLLILLVAVYPSELIEIPQVRFLTYHGKTEAENGLRLAEAVARSIESRTKLRYGIRQPR